MGSIQDEYYRYLQMSQAQNSHQLQAQAMYGLSCVGQSLSGPVTQATHIEPKPDPTLLLLDDE